MVACLFIVLYEPELREGMTLQPWQKLGVRFLQFHRRRTGFACLGDEMGVGKVAPRRT